MAKSGQTPIPAVLMRGGTSKGLFFEARDLPVEKALRDNVVLAAVGGDARQIDGVGGADPLTSKVAVVGPSVRGDADVDYLFLQVVVGEGRIDDTPNCGNILAGAAAFAIETGMVPAGDGETSVRVHMVNSGNLCEVIVPTPDARVSYAGDAAIDGVPGTAAPIICNYLDTAGSICGALLPSGNVRDVIDGVEVTMIDNGMPVIALRAADLGRSGYESRDELNADAELKARLEAIRLKAGPLMNLGNVADKVVPKMSLIAAPRAGGAVATRTFIPKVCHASIGVLGAVTVATACVLPGTVADGIAMVPKGARKVLSIEHPSGEFSVTVDVEETAGGPVIKRAGLLRTARALFRGEVLVPGALWDGISGRADNGI